MTIRALLFVQVVGTMNMPEDHLADLKNLSDKKVPSLVGATAVQCIPHLEHLQELCVFKEHLRR